MAFADRSLNLTLVEITDAVEGLRDCFRPLVDSVPALLDQGLEPIDIFIEGLGLERPRRDLLGAELVNRSQLGYVDRAIFALVNLGLLLRIADLHKGPFHPLQLLSDPLPALIDNFHAHATTISGVTSLLPWSLKNSAP